MKERSPLLPIFLIVVVDVLGMTIILPLLPFYAEHFGATPTVVGLLITAYALCQLVAGPLLGRISDRIGRKPLLIVSQIGTFVGFLVLAWARSLWVVFLSRIIDGSTAGNLSLAQAYISDVTRPENRAKAFGVIGVAFGIGFLFGPALSASLIHYGYACPILVAAGLSATSILATATLLPSATPHEGKDEPAGPAGKRLGLLDWGRYLEYFRQPDLAPWLWMFFAFAFAFSTFNSGFALFAERQLTWHGHFFGVKEVGYVLAYAGFLGILLQGGLIGRLVKRFGEPKLILSGFVAAAVGYAALGITATVGPLLLVTAVASYGTGILRPTITSMVTQRSHRREQGVVLGLTQSLTSVAQIIAPLCAGYLIERGWLCAWAALAALAMAVGAVLARPRARA